MRCGLSLLVIHGSTAKAPVCTFPRKTASGGDHYLSSGVAGWIVNQLQGNITLLALCIGGHTAVCFCSFLSLICSPPDIYQLPAVSFLFFISFCCLITCLDGTRAHVWNAGLQLSFFWVQYPALFCIHTAACWPWSALPRGIVGNVWRWWFLLTINIITV